MAVLTFYRYKIQPCMRVCAPKISVNILYTALVRYNNAFRLLLYSDGQQMITNLNSRDYNIVLTRRPIIAFGFKVEQSAPVLSVSGP